MGPVTKRAAMLHAFFTCTLFLCLWRSFLSKKHKNKIEMGPSDQEGGHAAWLFHLHIVSLSLLFFPLKEHQKRNWDGSQWPGGRPCCTAFSLAHCFFVFVVLSSQRNTKTKMKWIPVTRRAAILHGFFTCTLFLWTQWPGGRPCCVASSSCSIFLPFFPECFFVFNVLSSQRNSDKNEMDPVTRKVAMLCSFLILLHPFTFFSWMFWISHRPRRQTLDGPTYSLQDRTDSYTLNTHTRTLAHTHSHTRTHTHTHANTHTHTHAHTHAHTHTRPRTHTHKHTHWHTHWHTHASTLTFSSTPRTSCSLPTSAIMYIDR